MRKAKFFLAILVLGSSIGGVWASKIRVPHIFYKKTAMTGFCNVEITTALCMTQLGGATTPLSTVPTTATTCGTIRVTICL